MDQIRACRGASFVDETGVVRMVIHGSVTDDASGRRIGSNLGREQVVANAESAGRKPRRVDFDPLLWIWRMLTSVRFALFLIGFLLFVSLVGIAIPQLPIELRQNPAATDAWLALQEEKNFGFLTDPVHRLGLFEIFRAPSPGQLSLASAAFIGSLLLLVASVWRLYCEPPICRFGATSPGRRRASQTTTSNAASR